MIRLLVVDDDENLCRPVQRFFQKRDFLVDTAHTGTEAITHVRKNKPHLLFLDIGLPDMSGLDVLEEIKKIDETIKVIMITAYGNMENIERARSLGVNEYLTKPFSIDYLQREGVAKVQRQLFEELRKEHKKELQLRRLFQQYVPSHVVNEALEKKKHVIGGSKQKITVLLCDIKDSSKLTRKYEPEKVVRLLNEYFQTMAEPIYDNHGIVDKFLGDGVMGLFGAASADLYDAQNAITAARDMLESLKDFNKRNSSRYGEIVVRIAINTGEVIAGNIGCDKKIDYTVIGDAVNIAARIEESCKIYPNSILISESTFKEVKNLEAEELGYILPRRPDIKIYKL
ncbi:MAG: response regulator [Elusimicrobiota bacterium]